MAATVTRILVATDFSPASSAALAFGKTLANRFGASLHLLHVLEDPYVTGVFAPEVYAPPPAGLRESWLHSAEETMATLVTEADRTAFNIATEVVFGPIAHTIVERASQIGADLIVMGTHGRGGVAHLLMGSVAERVVRTAGCPVLTTRGGHGEEGEAVEAVEKAGVPISRARTSRSGSGPDRG
jgi:nucleotide-binding universal stress UspA family protein